MAAQWPRQKSDKGRVRNVFGAKRIKNVFVNGILNHAQPPKTADKKQNQREGSKHFPA